MKSLSAERVKEVFLRLEKERKLWRESADKIGEEGGSEFFADRFFAAGIHMAIKIIEEVLNDKSK